MNPVNNKSWTTEKVESQKGFEKEKSRRGLVPQT